MKGETLDWFVFILGAVAELVDEATVLRQMILRDLVLSLKMIPWADSNSQYNKNYVYFCVKRKSLGRGVVRGKEKEDKKTQKDK